MWFMRMSTDMGIDLGTATVLVYLKGKGVILKEPSVVAIDKNTNRILAVGEEARKMLTQAIESGKALDKLAEFVEAQGGDKEYVYHPEKLTLANIQKEITAEKEGYISHIECDEIGICSLILGGGRETKESEIDLSVGFYLHKKVGDYVKVGDSLATIYANDEAKLASAKERFLKAYSYSDTPINKTKFIKGIIE